MTCLLHCKAKQENYSGIPSVKLQSTSHPHRHSIGRRKETMSNNQYSCEASTSRCKKRTTTSDHLSDDVRSRRRRAELQQLEGRLRVLEEEAEMLKGALLESLEENKRQITEIHQHFNTIRRCLLQRQGESYRNENQIMSLFEDRRDGLLQVLCQDSNPSIVDKGLKFQAKLPWIFQDGD